MALGPPPLPWPGGWEAAPGDHQAGWGLQPRCAPTKPLRLSREHQKRGMDPSQ